MCAGLGMEVVAEGIEEEAQVAKLLQFGCGGGQGYLFGRPVDEAATREYLRSSAVAAPDFINGDYDIRWLEKFVAK